MTRITLSILGLLLAGLALSCSGTRADDDAAGLSLAGSATQSSVGRDPGAADADCAADCMKDCCEEGDDCDDAAGEDDGDDDQEVAVALADVPRLVLDAARAAVPGVVLTNAEMEQEDGQTVYSLSGTLDGEEVEIEVSATGKVLEIERD